MSEERNNGPTSLFIKSLVSIGSDNLAVAAIFIDLD
jgi:hypothetical protein